MKKAMVLLECNVTGDKIYYYEELFLKKVSEYGSEEMLRRYFAKQSVISMVKRGISMKEVCDRLGVSYNDDKKDFYNEFITFHVNLSSKNGNVGGDSVSTQMETDNEVKAFINKWTSHLGDKLIL